MIEVLFCKKIRSNIVFAKKNYISLRDSYSYPKGEVLLSIELKLYE